MSRSAFLTTQGKLPFVVVIPVIFATTCQPSPPTSTREPTRRPDEVRVGPLRRVSQPPYVLEPHIAVNPTNSNDLAAVVASLSEFEFSGGGIWKLVLYTSTTGGISRPGEYLGMASTDEFAYPIWIDTQGAEGTQAYTVRIER